MKGMLRGRLFCVFLIVALALSLSARGQTDRDRLTSIASALTAKEFDKALELLKPEIQNSREDPKLWTLQALALSGKGQKKAALLAYQKALNISPNFLPALEGAAQIQYEAGNQDAVPLLNRLLRLRPDDPTSHAMLAFLAYKKSDCAQAIEHFAKSGSLVDSQPASRDEYASCLLKLDRSEEAIPLYTRALELNSGDKSSRYRLTDLQLMLRRPKDAIETLAPLLQNDDPDAETLELAAFAYEAEGDTPLAVSTLRKAIVKDPRNVDLYLDFAVFSIDHRSYQVGIDIVNVGLKAEPKAAPLYVARGVLYVQLAQFDDAEKDFAIAENLDPSRGIGSVALGFEQAQANDLDRALKTVRTKLVGKPNDANLLFLQANILAQMGQEPGSANFQVALRSAKKAVTLQPSLVAARDLLAKLYFQAGLTDAAIDQSREALKVDPNDQTALYRLIQSLRKEDKAQEIPDLLKRLAELREEGTKEEREHNRYKLVEAPNAPSQP